MRYNVIISYYGNGAKLKFVPVIRLNFWHPYNEILPKCFITDSESSIGSIEKVDSVLKKIEELQSGNLNNYLIIGYDQDPVIECYPEKSKIIDCGPDEIHSIPPNEIYGPNWNKRHLESEWISTDYLKVLLKEWKQILMDYENIVCVPKSAVKEEYWKENGGDIV